DGKRWLLLNCSPDIGAQIQSFAPLHPRKPRGTPIAGILFTDANVDHLGGLATLRQSGEHRFIIRSSAIVRAIAAAQPAYAPFSQPPHRWLESALDVPCEAASDDDIVGNQLAVRAVSVPGTTPGYDGRRRMPGAVVAYEVSDLDRKNRLLFAPVFSSVDTALHAAIASVQVAFVDGTFYTADELVAQHLLPKRAESLGHQSVAGEAGTLERLRGIGTRVIFTHLNNSNPMLEPSSAASQEIRDAGAEIAYDGMELLL
ncbi:MAG: MBL fold metallo-hydrolase, partial [Candidatus Cybelea sp.]